MSAVAVKERPILFSAPMIQAILAGRKTQTRRIVKPVGKDEGFVLADLLGDSWWPFRSYDGESFDDGSGCEVAIECPYGKIGDRLYVKEAWKTRAMFDNMKPVDIGKRVGKDVLYLADNVFTDISGCRDEFVAGRYRHARFMPRWASRITLEIENVRVQRVQEISEEDARAEGIESVVDGTVGRTWKLHGDLERLNQWTKDPRWAFQCLWNSINGNWDENPWCWAIGFREVRPI
jgi:hypothetical protein